MSGNLDQTERAYRRGVHQALAFAYGHACRCDSLEQARAVLGMAEDTAERLRRDYSEGGGALLDTIAAALRVDAPGGR